MKRDPVFIRGHFWSAYAWNRKDQLFDLVGCYDTLEEARDALPLIGGERFGMIREYFSGPGIYYPGSTTSSAQFKAQCNALEERGMI
jgi:hypothetical protein